MLEKVNKKILIAVDESENAKRAVLYVGELLKGFPNFSVMLLHIVSMPPDDYFFDSDEKLKWQDAHRNSGELILKECSKILEISGFKDSSIQKILLIKPCSSIGECILEEAEKLGCSTVVIGRRGISKKEEFIFGSTSNKILHTPKKCTVWIVE